MKLKATYNKENIHDEWESIYRDNPLQDRFNDKMMDRVMAYLDPAPDALFLDAGCGIGDHSIRIAKRGYNCVGVDISKNILARAEEKILTCNLANKVSLVCQNLEDLPFSDETFDIIHCRGVLMHIPDWEKALQNLCRVLKTGGKIVLMESNHTSLEANLVLLLRRFRKTDSRLMNTESGLEFWSEKDGNPFLVRIARIKHLLHRLGEYQVDTLVKFATEFWDINRFPSGIIRNSMIRYNQMWFALGLPAYWSIGNCIIGKKNLRSA